MYELNMLLQISRAIWRLNDRFLLFKYEDDVFILTLLLKPFANSLGPDQDRP